MFAELPKTIWWLVVMCSHGISLISFSNATLINISNFWKMLLLRGQSWNFLKKFFWNFLTELFVSINTPLIPHRREGYVAATYGVGMVGMIWEQCPYRFALIFPSLSWEGLLPIGRTQRHPNAWESVGSIHVETEKRIPERFLTITRLQWATVKVEALETSCELPVQSCGYWAIRWYQCNLPIIHIP